MKPAAYISGALGRGVIYAPNGTVYLIDIATKGEPREPSVENLRTWLNQPRDLMEVPLDDYPFTAVYDKMKQERKAYLAYLASLPGGGAKKE